MQKRKIILTDTCALIMLIRIVPEMFHDPKYNCIMTEHVYNEFIKKPEFLYRFPWRSEYKKYLYSKHMEAMLEKNKDYSRALEYVKYAAKTAKNDKGRCYGLSKKDCEIVATSVCFCYDFCSGDRNLYEFAQNEFSIKTFSALELLNTWIDGGVLIWDDDKHKMLSMWKNENQRPQPEYQIERFKTLTMRTYPN